MTITKSEAADAAVKQHAPRRFKTELRDVTLSSAELNLKVARPAPEQCTNEGGQVVIRWEEDGEKKCQKEGKGVPNIAGVVGGMVQLIYGPGELPPIDTDMRDYIVGYGPGNFTDADFAVAATVEVTH